MEVTVLRYSSRIRQAVLRKVLPPQSLAVRDVALEFGISEQSIIGWLKLVKEGKLTAEAEDAGPRYKAASEKLALLLESKLVDPDRRGEWLREKGLHSEHLTLWEQELRELMDDKATNGKAEFQALKKRNRQLEKELERKNMALAELAALMTLKKKADEIWGANEGD
jgi:transposase-like protein